MHHFLAELAQIIDNEFLCKLLAGVTQSLETEDTYICISLATCTLDIELSL